MDGNVQLGVYSMPTVETVGTMLEPYFGSGLPARLSKDGELAWSMLELPSSPIAPSRLHELCGLVDAANRTNLLDGHEHAGPLSWERGFLPSEAPRLALEPEFSVWDEVAARLPELYDSLKLRETLRALPVLDARRLDVTSLQRAATVLSILAHSYRNVVPDEEPYLPECLAIPWEVTCHRLHRPVAMMTYADLILQNWRQRDPSRVGPNAFDLDNLDLLVPAVGTEAERVFYLTQVEITWRLARLLQRYVEAATALLEERESDAEAAIIAMRDLVAHVGSESLHRITASARRGDRIDPVAWAKTVAPLAVSARKDVPGPSGTSNPALHLLDEITGRHSFTSQLGREALALREVMPNHWRSLFELLRGEASLAAPIARGFRPTLRAAWNELVRVYSGPGGFLDTHRIKVYGFIEVAFKVGRSVTIGGFAGPFASRTWEEVDAALSTSGSERPGYVARAGDRAAASALQGASHLPDLGLAEFYQRVLRGGAPLAHAYGWVIDLSKVRHPGGGEILALYEGRNLAGVFARVAHLERATTRLQIQHAIVAKLTSNPGTWSTRLVPLVERFIEIAKALQLETSLLDRPLTRAPRPPQGLAPLSAWHGAHALVRAGEAFCNWALTDGLVRLVKSTSSSAAGREEARRLWLEVARVDAALRRCVSPGETGEQALRAAHAHLTAALEGCALGLATALNQPDSTNLPVSTATAEALDVLAGLFAGLSALPLVAVTPSGLAPGGFTRDAALPEGGHP
jgi:Indoleamine 2,3-dioxygenase